MVSLREFGIEVTEIDTNFPTSGGKYVIDTMIAAAETLEGTEGWIIRFDSGHMLKIKTDWYRDIHGCVTEIRFEKDVLALILNKRLDDISEFLTDTMRDKINDYAEEVHEGFLTVAFDIATTVHEHEHVSKKEFALKFKDDLLFKFMIDLFDKKDTIGDTWTTYTYEKLWKYTQEHVWSQTWVDRYRHLYNNKKFEF
jgi:hypothetical protein